MMFREKKEKNYRHSHLTLRIIFVCVLLVCSVVFCIPASAYNPSPVERYDFDAVVPLGQSNLSNHRGWEYLGTSHRVANADLYYAAGQSVVRHNVTYPFYDFNGANDGVWLDKLVEAGYSFNFIPFDAVKQGFNFQLPLTTGVEYGISCYLTDITFALNGYTLFQTRVSGCSITVRYCLYDGSDGDDVNLHLQEFKATKNLTANEITDSMGKSNKFEQNWQSNVFNYIFKLDFGRPVLISGIDVKFVFQLHSDTSRKEDIGKNAYELWKEIQTALETGKGPMYNALRQTGFICDYSFPRLTNYFYNTYQMRDEFISLGLKGNYTLWLDGAKIDLDDLESLSLTSAVAYAGNSLKVYGALLVRIISLDLVNAILGAVLTLSVISAFIGVAVFFGKRKG